MGGLQGYGALIIIVYRLLVMSWRFVRLRSKMKLFFLAFCILSLLGVTLICGVAFIENIWAASRSAHAPDWRDIYMHRANVSAAMALGSIVVSSLLVIKLYRDVKRKNESRLDP